MYSKNYLNLSKSTRWPALLCLSLLLFCVSAWSQVTPSPNGQAQSSVAVPSPLSLADEVTKAIKAHPDMEPLLMRIVGRLDSISTKLDKPQQVLIAALLDSEETIKLLLTQNASLRTELTTSRDLLTKSDAELTKERTDKQAAIVQASLQTQVEKDRADSAEKNYNISLWVNIGLGAMDLGLILYELFRQR